MATHLVPALSLQPAPSSRVFMELVPWADRGRENNQISTVRPNIAQAQPGSREVHVSGAADLSATPDRAQVIVRVTSTKEAAAEAKKSVCRRLNYIMQSLQQQGLPVSVRGRDAGRGCFVTSVVTSAPSGAQGMLDPFF